MALGEPDAGKPPVRFDEGRSETVIGLCLSIRPLRLLYSISKSVAVVLVNPVVRPDVEQMDFHSGTFPRPNKFKNDAEIVTNRARPAPLEITGKIVGPQRGMVWLSFKRLERCLQSVQGFGLVPCEFLHGTRKLGRPDELHSPRGALIVCPHDFCRGSTSFSFRFERCRTSTFGVLAVRRNAAGTVMWSLVGFRSESSWMLSAVWCE